MVKEDVRSWTSSRRRCVTSLKSFDDSSIRITIPVVAYTSFVDCVIWLSNLTAKPISDLEVPTSCFLSPNSSLTRRASEIAEILRGSVQYILQSRPWLSSFSSMYAGICVLFPQPVSPHTITTWLACIASRLLFSLTTCCRVFAPHLRRPSLAQLGFSGLVASVRVFESCAVSGKKDPPKAERSPTLDKIAGVQRPAEKILACKVTEPSIKNPN